LFEDSGEKKVSEKMIKKKTVWAARTSVKPCDDNINNHCKFVIDNCLIYLIKIIIDFI